MEHTRRDIYEANKDLFEHVSRNTGENITDIVNLGTVPLDSVFQFITTFNMHFIKILKITVE